MILVLVSFIVLFYFILQYPFDLLNPLLKRIESVSLPPCLHIMIVGRDRTIEGSTRSDVIIIAGVDLKSGRIILSNIPRDLIYAGRKINSYYAEGGIVLLKKVISNITGLSIDRYAVFDYDSFKIIGDEVGPITVVVKQPMRYYDAVQDLKIDFLPGVYNLNGAELLAYVRYRKGGMGDLDRIRRQREVLTKMLEKIMNAGLDKIITVYSKVSDKIETDFSLEELITLAMKLKKGYSLHYLNFPIVFLEDGSIVMDIKKVKEFKQAFENFEIKAQQRYLRIMLVNAKRKKTKVFQPIEEARWKKIAGFTPVQYVWEDLGQYIKGSIVFITNKDPKVKLEVEKLLKKLYTKRKFIFYDVAHLNMAKDYYSFITMLSEKRKYPHFPLDAIVILGELP